MTEPIASPVQGPDGLHRIGARIVCGARNRRGGHCTRPPAKGRTRCKLHGGASLCGPASPAFKHGRHSRYLPPRLLESYQASVDDPNLIVLRDDLALVETRMGDLLKHLDVDGFRAQWLRARHAFDAFHQANVRGDGPAMKASLAELSAALTSGLADHVKWDQVLELVEQKRRLSETEQRRLERAHNVMTNERAMVLLARIVDVIRRHVTEPVALSAIAAEIQTLAAYRPEALPR